MDEETAKKIITLEKLDDGVYVATLQDKLFTMETSRAMHYWMDVLDKTEGPQCLITTAKHEKIFSAGFDFNTFEGHEQDVHNRLAECGRMLARFCAVGYPTICAISGHCYAAGFVFAMCHDFRMMRDDFGNMCLSEINIGMSVPRGFNAHVLKKISLQTHTEAVLHGKKFTPQEALKHKIVDFLVPKQDL